MDDAFGLLGLKADASVTDVKAAYRGLGEFFFASMRFGLVCGSTKHVADTPACPCVCAQQKSITQMSTREMQVQLSDSSL